MTPTRFIGFRAEMARRMEHDMDILSDRKTAELLGCSKHFVRKWTAEGTPLFIDYACQAIIHNLLPYGVERKVA